MGIVEFEHPSGYGFSGITSNAGKNESWSKVEQPTADNTAVYFDSFSKEESFDICLQKIADVIKQKPIYVTAYDYYNPGKGTVKKVSLSHDGDDDDDYCNLCGEFCKECVTKILKVDRRSLGRFYGTYETGDFVIPPIIRDMNPGMNPACSPEIKYPNIKNHIEYMKKGSNREPPMSILEIAKTIQENGHKIRHKKKLWKMRDCPTTTTIITTTNATSKPEYCMRKSSPEKKCGNIYCQKCRKIGFCDICCDERTDEQYAANCNN